VEVVGVVSIKLFTESAKETGALTLVANESGALEAADNARSARDKASLQGNTSITCRTDKIKVIIATMSICVLILLTSSIPAADAACSTICIAAQIAFYPQQVALRMITHSRMRAALLFF
jgi:hypothetical protein